MDSFPIGYGKLAYFLSTDPNFLIYRKFSYLHNRLLLNLQDELAELEEDLEIHDQFDFERDGARLASRRANKFQGGKKRREIFKQIEQKLAEYGVTALTGYDISNG